MTAQESPPAIDAREFRTTMGCFATGVTIVTTAYESQTHGMTANAFMSISLNPPLILVSIDHRAKMHQYLPLSGWYGVSVLAADQEALSQHFAGRPIEGLEIPFFWVQDVPLLRGAVAHIVARVVDAHMAGDHTLYIGQVEYLDRRESKPLLYFNGRYRHVADMVFDPGVSDLESPSWWLGW